MGFHYTLKVNEDRHKFFGGNHDNYTIYNLSPHQIGNYGNYTHGGIDFFFIRGAFSIDRRYRTMGVDWWQDEELNGGQMRDAFEAYVASKPSIVLTHACPAMLAPVVGKPGALRHFGFNPGTFSTATQTLLQNCWEAHKPDMWIFGHMHKTWKGTIDGTEFQCLDELECVDLC